MKISKKQLSLFIFEAIKEIGFIKPKPKQQMEKDDTIPGGLAQGKTLTDLVAKLDPKGYFFNDQLLNALRKELIKGIEVELEHTSDLRIAKEIALDHLFEDPRYYTRLAKANLEENTKTTFTNPNFETEWDEAKRYPEFKEMGKEAWIKLANQGKSVSYDSIKDVLGNVDLNFDELEEPKKQRFQKALKDGKVEMPIAVKFSNDDYDLVAGNTRLAGMVANEIPANIWIVDLS
jgi:hypothetical protein